MNSILWDEIDYKLNVSIRKIEILSNELNLMRLIPEKKISNDIVLVKKKKKKRKKKVRKYFNNRVIDTSEEELSDSD